MKWKTAISVHKNGELYIGGKALTKLIENHSFTEAIFLVLKGALPNKREKEMFDAILVAPIEHGVEAPSAFVARTVASVGNPMNVALAAGFLATGDWHGGAIEQAARMFQSSRTPSQIVSGALSKKERVSGYGHKIYKDTDPRAKAIFAKAKKLKFYGKYVGRAIAIQKELEKQSGKKLPLNIDAAIAAIISELGFDWRLGKAFFALGRLPGIIAHAHEEMVNEKPYRRFEESDVEYVGKPVKNTRMKK